LLPLAGRYNDAASDRRGQRPSRDLNVRLRVPNFITLGLLAAACFAMTGCIVSQPPGNGIVHHLREPATGGSYFVYLPEDYVQKRRPTTGDKWPLVVTFHGMRPFDDAGSQIREWQQEADRYGFVVLAPKTATSDLFRQFASVRVRNVTAAVRRDEKLTLAAMDEVIRRFDVDPTKVLTTSWSSGGYLAHYMANRHPERFSCIAPRQSNFSSDILDDAQVPKYRDVKVGIFYTENDFAICRRESQEGAQWYASRGFDVTFAVFRDLGHARRPSVAADFFARQIGAVAKTPPIELARMQVTRVPLPGLNGNGKKTGASRVSTAANGKVINAAQLTGTESPPSAPHPEAARRGPTGSNRPSPQPAVSGSISSRVPAADNPLRLRVSSPIGLAPHALSFSALVPDDVARGATFLWTDNGVPIASGINGQTSMAEPGEHILEVVMTTRDGKTYSARKAINVIERLRRGNPNP